MGQLRFSYEALALLSDLFWKDVIEQEVERFPLYAPSTQEFRELKRRMLDSLKPNEYGDEQ